MDRNFREAFTDVLLYIRSKFNDTEASAKIDALIAALETSSSEEKQENKRETKKKKGSK